MDLSNRTVRSSYVPILNRVHLYSSLNCDSWAYVFFLLSITTFMRVRVIASQLALCPVIVPSWPYRHNVFADFVI